MRKKPSEFVQQSYNINNQSGIEKMIPYLISNGYDVPHKEEDYGVDIIAFKNGVEHRFEIEIKNTEFTNRESYPWDTVSFLSRKQKMAYDEPFWYVLISPVTNWFLFCDSTTIYQKQYREKIHIDTLYRKGDDYFYRVPKELCNFRNLKLCQEKKK